jgi:hypothetical protein
MQPQEITLATPKVGKFLGRLSVFIEPLVANRQLLPAPRLWLSEEILAISLPGLITIELSIFDHCIERLGKSRAHHTSAPKMPQIARFPSAGPIQGLRANYTARKSIHLKNPFVDGCGLGGSLQKVGYREIGGD